MAVRQYIGARYVTKIYENTLDPSSAEWESGVAYEPLTMVTYQNSSYLSKKEVPATVGDPAANPSYWVLTGAYNGQIASLQNDILGLQNDINTIEPQVGSGNNLSYDYGFIMKDSSFCSLIAEGDTTYNNLQGFAYDSLRHRIAIILENGTDINKAVIATVDADDYTIVYTRKYYTDYILGHGGDFAYNPTTDRFVQCPNDSDNTINEIDANTLNIVDTHNPLPGPLVYEDNMIAAAYNEDDDVYYIETPNSFIVLDNTFTQIDRVIMTPYNAVKNMPSDMTTFTWNGFEYFRGKIWCLIQSSDTTGVMYNFLVGVNMDGSIYTSYELPNTFPNNEYESILVIDGIFHAFSRRILFTDTLLALQKDFVFNHSNVFGFGKPLKAGMDMDDILAPGFYNVTSAAIGAAITNCPSTNSGGDLYVFVSGFAIIQMYLAMVPGSMPIVWMRRITSSTVGTSVAWHCINSKDSWIPINETLTLNQVYATGVITTSGQKCIFTIPGKNMYVTSNYPITNVTVAGTIIIRTPTGYYTHNGNHACVLNTNSEFTTTLTNASGGIQVEVALPTAHTDNNIPVTVELYITLKNET